MSEGHPLSHPKFCATPLRLRCCRCGVEYVDVKSVCPACGNCSSEVLGAGKAGVVKPGWCWLRLKPRKGRHETGMAFIAAIVAGVKFRWKWGHEAQWQVDRLDRIDFYLHVPFPEES